MFCKIPHHYRDRVFECVTNKHMRGQVHVGHNFVDETATNSKCERLYYILNHLLDSHILTERLDYFFVEIYQEL